jgi:hypothetical protein
MGTPVLAMCVKLSIRQLWVLWGSLQFIFTKHDTYVRDGFDDGKRFILYKKIYLLSKYIFPNFIKVGEP